MRANLLIKPGVLRFTEIKTPKPSSGEILVRIKAGLTCGTDLKAYRRGHPLMPMPAVFGHEFAGIIEAVGRGVKDFSPGTEVMAVHSAPCGTCYYCNKSLFNLCSDIMQTKVLGAFAEYIVLPKHIVNKSVFEKPENLSFPEAAFLEPLACVFHSVQSAGISHRETAVIIGAGPIGLLHLMALKSMGVSVIVIEKHVERLKKAREEGADVVIHGERENITRKTLSYTEQRGADVVFECTGVPAVWEHTLRLVRRGGTVVLFGGCKPGSRVTYDAGRIHYDEIKLQGVFHFNPSDIDRAYTVLSQRLINVRSLISGYYPLRDLRKAFEKLAKGEGIKYAIIP